MSKHNGNGDTHHQPIKHYPLHGKGCFQQREIDELKRVYMHTKKAQGFGEYAIEEWLVKLGMALTTMSSHDASQLRDIYNANPDKTIKTQLTDLVAEREDISSGRRPVKAMHSSTALRNGLTGNGKGVTITHAGNKWHR